MKVLARKRIVGFEMTEPSNKALDRIRKKGIKDFGKEVSTSEEIEEISFLLEDVKGGKK